MKTAFLLSVLLITCGVIGATNEATMKDVMHAMDSIAEESGIACPADVLFVLDATGSMRYVFDDALDYIAKVLEGLTISEHNDHVGVVLYSSSRRMKLRIPLGSINDRSTLMKSVKGLPFLSGITATGAALKLAALAMNDRRTKVHTNVVVITDGFSYDTIKDYAPQLRQQSNVNVYAVALGDTYFREGLETIAGSEDGVLLGMTSYGRLVKMIKDCNGKSKKENSHHEAPPMETIHPAGLPTDSKGRHLIPNPKVKMVNEHVKSTKKPSAEPAHLTNVATGNTEQRLTLKATNNADVHLKSNTKEAPAKSFQRMGKLPDSEGRPLSTKSRLTVVEHRMTDSNSPPLKPAHRANTNGNNDKHSIPNANAKMAVVQLKAENNSSTKSDPRNNTTTNSKEHDNKGKHLIANTRIRMTNEQMKDVKYTPTRPDHLVKNLTGSAQQLLISEAKTKKNDARAISTGPSSAKSAQDTKALPCTGGLHMTGNPMMKMADQQRKSSKTIPVEPVQYFKTTTDSYGRHVMADPRAKSFEASYNVPSSRYEMPSQNQIDIDVDGSGSGSGCVFDVAIVFDASGSVEDVFKDQLAVASRLIDRVTLGPEDTQIAVIRYAGRGKSRALFGFKDIVDKKEMKRRISDVSFISGTTYTNEALKKAAELFKGPDARMGKARQVAIVFTDGFSGEDPIEGARLLRKLGVMVFAIAIDKQGNEINHINQDELKDIAGHPSRVFTMSNIAEFEEELGMTSQNCLRKKTALVH
ncbi:unnamed protein product [Nippostrongylus brasiliensis]|uniref:VWFA domain-containing protein n=1 Tax=Nippostrongylus brasiliensis TaxID=27835 RepID=A0A0N4Y601_NIPBR|nr:unnamed protein product [Nippostrongylus brasiliensis]